MFCNIHRGSMDYLGALTMVMVEMCRQGLCFLVQAPSFSSWCLVIIKGFAADDLGVWTARSFGKGEA